MKFLTLEPLILVHNRSNSKITKISLETNGRRPLFAKMSLTYFQQWPIKSLHLQVYNLPTLSLYITKNNLLPALYSHF